MWERWSLNDLKARASVEDLLMKLPSPSLSHETELTTITLGNWHRCSHWGFSLARIQPEGRRLTYHWEDTAEEVLWEVGFKRCTEVSWQWELRKHIPRGNNLCKGTTTDI